MEYNRIVILGGLAKKSRGRGESAAVTLNFGEASGGEAGRLRDWVLASGVKKEGGNLLRGNPRLKDTTGTPPDASCKPLHSATVNGIGN